jgi:hypothetical protein
VADHLAALSGRLACEGVEHLDGSWRPASSAPASALATKVGAVSHAAREAVRPQRRCFGVIRVVPGVSGEDLRRPVPAGDTDLALGADPDEALDYSLAPTRPRRPTQVPEDQRSAARRRPCCSGRSHTTEGVRLGAFHLIITAGITT